MTAQKRHREGVIADGLQIGPDEPVYTGMVVMFNTTVPTGWIICDGANGTLNLRDRFVVGAGGSYSLGAAGGTNAVTLSYSELPFHNHNASAGSASHTHNTSLNGGGHNHALTITTTSHSHNYTGIGAYSTYANQFANYVATSNHADNFTGAATEAAHSTVTSNGSSATHSHTAYTAGAHSHGATNSNGAGSGGSHENRPPYYALVYAQATATATPVANMICMTEGAVPTGWVALNATNLPDVRDRFIVGSGTTYSTGATGGSNTVTLSTTSMPNHAHTASYTTDNLGHEHTTNAVSHTHTVSLSAHSSHVHGYNYHFSNTLTIGSSGKSIRATPSTGTSGSNGSPAHTVTFGNQFDNHGHVSTSQDSGHAHNWSGGNSGSTGAHENRPPYRATTFIRRTLADTTTDFPSGTIVMFNGTTIPTGWTEATNYRDRFPVGAGLSYAVGGTGGANAVSLGTTEMPLHNHNGGSNTTGAHEHAIEDGGSSHTHTGSASHGNHSHGSLNVTNSATSKITGNVITALANAATQSMNAGTSGHTHNASYNSSNADHTHSASGGSHAHTTNLSYEGSGSAHENRPPYTALTFIIKT